MLLDAVVWRDGGPDEGEAFGGRLDRGGFLVIVSPRLDGDVCKRDRFCSGLS